MLLFIKLLFVYFVYINYSFLDKLNIIYYYTKPQLAVMAAPAPTSTSTFTVSVKTYTIQPSCDIGAFLNSISMKPYEKITVTLKPGNYFWEENVTVPERCELKIIGEGYENGGRKNKAFVSITHKGTYTYNGKDYAVNSRLVISRDATAEIAGINIRETINDEREKTPCACGRGVFTLGGDNARFSLCQGEFDVSTSPVVNTGGQVLGRVLFGHSHFRRLAHDGSGVIQIVGTETGWSFGGSKVIVSCSHTDCDAGCVLEGRGVELIR